MTAPTPSPLLAPDVEALLAEIAVDPESNLLRVPRRGGALSGSDPPDSARTRAERHLAAVHGEEVALTLARIAAAEGMRRTALGHALLDEHPRSQAELRQRALLALATAPAQVLSGRTRSDLGRWLERSGELKVRPLAFLTAALRLGEPRGARAWVPLLQLAEGQPHGAYLEARRLAAEPSAAGEVAVRASNAGMLACLQGHHGEAARHYEAAAHARPDLPVYAACAWLNAFFAHLDGFELHLRLAGARELLANSAESVLAPIRAALTAFPPAGFAQRVERGKRARRVPTQLADAAEVFHAVL